MPQDEVHQEESALEDNTVIGTVTCGGRPVGGVPVSDGVNIVQTDADGKYVLQTEKTTGIVFISSPSGYVPGSKDGVKPNVIHIAQESRADGPVYSINLGDISHERW